MPQQDLSPAPTALPCLSKGPLSQMHSWAHVPAWPLPVPIPSEVPSAPWLPCPWEWHCLVALQEALALTANKTKGNVMRRHFTKEVHLKSLNTPLKISYLEFHIASHKTLEQPDWSTIILLWGRHGSVHLTLSQLIFTLTVCFCYFPYTDIFFFFCFQEARAGRQAWLRKNAECGRSIFSCGSMFLKSQSSEDILRNSRFTLASTNS